MLKHECLTLRRERTHAGAWFSLLAWVFMLQRGLALSPPIASQAGAWFSLLAWVFMLQRGLASSPPVASRFHHVVAPNPSHYNVMPRPMFLSKPISSAL